MLHAENGVEQQPQRSVFLCLATITLNVLVNGTDIREFNRQECYSLFSAVFQDLSLPDVIIAENVTQRTAGIDFDRVRDCIDKAGLTDFIDSRPDGLNTHVSREVYLDDILISGGQTQQMMLPGRFTRTVPF